MITQKNLFLRIMKKNFYLCFFLVILFVTGCSWKKDRLDADVSGIIIPQVKIHRYDLDLFNIPVNDLSNGLKKIQHEYYYFLGTDLNDPMKLKKMDDYLQNPRNQEFQAAVKNKFKDLSATEEELTKIFRHYRYYFPGMKIPRVYSYISGGDYENQIRADDSVMIIALDTYLGKEFKPYQEDGLPLYRMDGMDPGHIVPDAARALVNTVIAPDPSLMSLLDHMLEAGKRLYIMKALVPSAPDNMIFDYSPAKYEWITKNESHIWAAIIENRMLFSGNSELFRTFFADGPCTPDFGNQSPPRLGEWIGYRIVYEYMQKDPGIKMEDLIREKDSQKILRISGYKPEK
jgi:hypothetical protein